MSHIWPESKHKVALGLFAHQIVCSYIYIVIEATII